MAEFFTSLDTVQLAGAWVTIGSFDGVHLGHQALVRQMADAAHAAGQPAAVITFFPHPSVVLRGIQGPFYLTGPDERARLLAGLGIDVVVTLTFNQAMAALSARDFMSRLRERLDLRQLWVGPNFALGRGREGDLTRLTQLGNELGYQVQVIEPVLVDGLSISSTQIRSWLAEGTVARVNQGLGRCYSASGAVIHGDGRGSAIGIPTANVDFWKERVMPANGVYAVWAWVLGQRWPAVANIGVRPTFEAQPVQARLEALLLDYDGDLYGQDMRVDFVAHLRDEQRFNGIQPLLAQIERDKQNARQILSQVAYDNQSPADLPVKPQKSQP